MDTQRQLCKSTAPHLIPATLCPPIECTEIRDRQGIEGFKMDLPLNWIVLAVLGLLSLVLIIAQLFHLSGLLKLKAQWINKLNDQKQRDLANSFDQAQHEQLQQSVSELTAKQTALQNTQDYLNSIINSMPSIMVGVTRQGSVIHWNSSATMATNLLPHEALGQNLNALQAWIPVSVSDIELALNTGKTRQFKNESVENGLKRYQSITIYPLASAHDQGAVIRIDDVSHQVQLENMMVQNNKLVSLGELSANLIHELNNPLAAVTQNNQSLRRRLFANEDNNQEVANRLGLNWDNLQTYFAERDIPKLVNAADAAGQRAVAIIHNMLKYTRTVPYEHKPTPINPLIHTTLQLLDSDTNNVAISCHLDSENPSALINGAEIQQVLINLITNAEQAIDAHPQGAIQISTEVCEQQVLIRIKDNGKGIPAPLLEKIFEPFYTTKEEGLGTGLGLSISHYIVTEQHLGTLSVESTVNTGTEFCIGLPLASTIKNQNTAQSNHVEYA